MPRRSPPDPRWQQLEQWLVKRQSAQERFLRRCLDGKAGAQGATAAAFAIVPSTRAQELELILEHVRRLRQAHPRTGASRQ